MKIKAIEFDDDGEFDTVTVQMTAHEAAFVAVNLGELNGNQANAIMPHGDELNTAIYDALVGRVFNALYDNGLNEFLRERVQ